MSLLLSAFALLVVATIRPSDANSRWSCDRLSGFLEQFDGDCSVVNTCLSFLANVGFDSDQANASFENAAVCANIMSIITSP